MENLSCHSNQSINATARKNKYFVAVNAMNILQSFSFTHNIASEELIFEYFFFANLAF